MGTIAEKLTYLNTTKEKIRDSINLTGANIGTSDTFRSYATKLKKGYIDIINNGIDTLYNNFPKVSGIGSNLSLTPTYEAPMKLNEIQGDTLQENTPTPNTPVPIQSVTGLQNINVCGKNLFDINGTVTQGTLDKYNNGFTLVKGTNRVIRFVLPKVLPAGTYTLSYDTINVENVSGNYFYVSCQYTNTNIGILNDIILNDSGATFTTTDEFDRLYFFIAGNQSNDATITIDNVQLEKGSTATDYEPYKGNTYEVNLGKNLFDINGTFTGNLIKYNNGFQLIKNSTNRTINYLPSSPIPKGTYTLSYEIVSSTLSDVNKLLIQFFNASNTNILTKTLSSTGSLNCILTEDVNKIYFYISNSEETDTQITFDNIQLEKGTQSTSFSPYFTPIELNKIGDYQDYIYKNNDNWYKHNVINEYIFTGNESNYGTWTNNRIVITDIPSDYLKVANNNTNALAVCSHYSITSRANNSSIDNSLTFYSSTDNATGTIINDSVHNTNTLLSNYFKQLYQANTPVKLYYVLNTPTDTQITNTELIEDLETLYTAKSQEGTTNISITSEDLEMILNVSALKGEV